MAVRVLGVNWPEGFPDDALGLPAFRHWRLLQRGHAARYHSCLALPRDDLEVVRHPDPDVVQILDPRPLLDQASIAAHYGGTGLLVAETLAAGVAYRSQLWFGLPANIGRLLTRAADELAVDVRIVV